MKKRIAILLLIIFFLLFILMLIMIGLDNRYNNKVYDDIKKNTGVNSLKYVNKYNDYYIVLDNDYLYLFSNDYVEITRIGLELIHENTKNYDIIYKDETLFYINNYKNKKGIIIEYYDIYKYKLVDKIVLGGK